MAVALVPVAWLIGTAAEAAAQVSLVPAHHPVYEWLRRQHVAGRLPVYQAQTLPASRGEILRMLTEVRDAPGELGATDRALLDEFAAELDPEGLRAASGAEPLSGPEPHLWAHASERSIAAVDGLLGLGGFRGGEPGESGSAALPEVGLRGYGDLDRRVGAHLEVDRLLSSGEEVRAARFDPRYGRTREVLREGGDGSWYVEATASAEWKVIRGDAGRGALRMGAGAGEPLLLAPGASGIDWVRWRLATPQFSYTALHGALGSPLGDSATVLRGDGSVVTRSASSRWLAVHRIEISLRPNMLLGFSEALVYSARSADLAYVNPVNVLFFSELDNEDRDNVIWIADATWRPIHGLELSGTMLGDDLGGLPDLLPFGDAPGKDRAWDWNASLALPYGVDLSGRYLKVEPFVYTHWQRLNAYEQNGVPLGHSLGPNADRWGGRVRKWLSGRGWVAASLSRTRKGLNPVDASGAVTENVGGDVTLGTVLETAYFFLERADVQEYVELGLEGEWEPRRGVRLRGRYLWRNVLEGSRLAGFDYVSLGVSFGY